MGTKPQHQRHYAPIPGMLRRMREAAGFSQRGLADKLENSQNFIQTSETGSRRVDLGEFVLWAQACGVSPDAALTDYLAASRSSKPSFWDQHAEFQDSPQTGPPAPSPAKVKKAKALLQRALKELGGDEG